MIILNGQPGEQACSGKDIPKTPIMKIFFKDMSLKTYHHFFDLHERKPMKRILGRM